MDASILTQVLRDLPGTNDRNVLVNSSSRDDAGVYRLSETLALVQTVDFFTPVVDDPRTFGRIAAANALSDVYAMGGRPITALAIAAFPEEIDPAILAAILAGGAEKAAQAGVSIVGGHTVKDDEPKYGLAITGLIHPDRIIRNNTGRPGDILVQTKPLGTGILTTARRRDAIEDGALAQTIETMETLNDLACEAMLEVGVRAATDVTGFGLIGHLSEMTGGELGADIIASDVPLLENALALAQAGCVPTGTRANRANALASGVRFASEIGEALELVLCDAQTSGGLLIAVDPARARALLEALAARSVFSSTVGHLTDGKTIRVCA